MTAAKHIELMSVEDYLAREELALEKSEYLGGYVYAMAGARNAHNLVATRLLVELSKRLEGGPCSAWNSDTKVRVRTNGYTYLYYPDASVVCDPNPGADVYHDRPVLVAEVLSPSTRRSDEGEKRIIYSQLPSMKLYLLLEQDECRVTVYRRTAEAFDLEAYSGLDSVIPLPELGIELPLEPLYRGIENA
ncbi:hypothetical protein Pla175_00730 [Pirellulimonas nuda]|uniref:Putative restriction endonuclease domain-containing protein n=1 Tax=Pirellulimonas nuda TaxID=2528009 RepID=A0A518D5H4_9BACT|nr:Uma2 family endonuclease [Pirellulimonas nuda]QDU86723.1 hypothetical protein Pla175_00730 [Pirellulimonas nuda]